MLDRTFRIVRGAATALLLVAVVEGITVAGLRPGYGPLFLGLGASVVCCGVIVALWELD
jgi:hypothetical protein